MATSRDRPSIRQHNKHDADRSTLGGTPMARGVLAPDHSIPIDVANRLEVEPQTQGFSDRDCGCSWIAPVTCVFRDCKRSSLVVVFGHLDGFCNHKVSKRSAQRDRRQILHTGGRVASPRPGIARPHASPGQPSTEPPHVPCGSAPGLACGSPSGRSRGRHTRSPDTCGTSDGWPSPRPARLARARVV